MDPKLYKALQDEKAQIIAESKRVLGNENATPEEIAAAAARVNDRLPQVEAQIAAIERLHKTEETAPARPQSASGIQVTEGFERDPMGGFASLGEFAIEVRRASHPQRFGGEVDPRLRALQAAPVNPMMPDGDGGEGYQVPTEIRQGVWKAVLGGEGLLARFNPEPTNSNTVGFQRDETTPWGALGVQAVWLDAGEQLTPSKPDQAQTLIKLARLAAFVSADEDLLEDAPRLTSRLQVSAPDAINYRAEEALINGNGIGKPLGVAKSAALVSVAKKAGQAAASLVPHNFGSMFGRAINPTNAFWIGSKTTMAALLEMNVGNQPVFIPQNQGLVGAPSPATVLGLPYIFSRHCENLGTKGDVYMIDPAGYMCAIKSGGTKFDSSIHLFFDYAVTAFRWIFRIGGAPILSAPITGPKSVTESHFLTIDTRA